MIDCLLIGHNEMDFETYRKTVSMLGARSEAYRDLNLNFIEHEGKAYTLPETFNYLFSKASYYKNGLMDLGNVFSPAIAHLGTVLNKHGLTFTAVNSFQREQDKLRELLSQNKVAALAITTTLYTSIFPIIEIVKFIRSLDERVKIIVGGPYVATQVRTLDEKALGKHWSRIGADFYINSSQGEKTLVDLLQCIKAGGSIEKVNNLYYLVGGQYRKTALKKEDNRLEENMPDWRLFAEEVKNIVALRTSISCPFACSFCGFPESAGAYQTVSVDKLEETFEKIEQLKTVTCVNITDDTFNVPLERFKSILRMKIENGYAFKWNSYIRCQYLDEEAVLLMKESGCEGAFLGIESANQTVLNHMNKQVKVEDYERGIRLLQKHGIMTFASFIFGFPGETEESVAETVQWIKTMKPDFYRIQLWYCEKKTPIWQERERFGLTGSHFNWVHETMDSQQAMGHIEKAFLEIDESIWLPQYNFDFVGMFNLLHRGMAMEDMKIFIRWFNEHIRQKLKKGNYNEA